MKVVFCGIIAITSAKCCVGGYSESFPVQLCQSSALLTCYIPHGYILGLSLETTASKYWIVASCVVAFWVWEQWKDHQTYFHF